MSEKKNESEVKEEKVGFLTKAKGFIKRNWKKALAGVALAGGGFAGGYVVGKHSAESYDDYDQYSPVDDEPTE